MPGIAVSHRGPAHSITRAPPECSSAILIVTGILPKDRWENRLYEKILRGFVQEVRCADCCPGGRGSDCCAREARLSGVPAIAATQKTTVPRSLFASRFPVNEMTRVLPTRLTGDQYPDSIPVRSGCLGSFPNAIVCRPVAGSQRF